MFSKIKKTAKRKLSYCGSQIALHILIYLLIAVALYFILPLIPKIKFAFILASVIMFLILFLAPSISITISYVFYSMYCGASVNPFSYFPLSIKFSITAWKIVFKSIWEQIKLCWNFKYFIIFVSATTFILILFFLKLYIITSILSFILSLTLSIYIYIKGLYLSFTLFSFFDNTEKTIQYSILKSKRLMLGNRLKLFLLNLSFIPYFLLLVAFYFAATQIIIMIPSFILTLILQLLMTIYEIWLGFYIYFTNIAFYKNITSENNMDNSYGKLHKNINKNKKFNSTVSSYNNYNPEPQIETNLDTFDTGPSEEDFSGFDIEEDFDSENNE